MAARDPLDELGRLWDGLEAPRPDTEADVDDPVVAWMRSAWRALEAPEPRVCEVLGTRARTARRFPLRALRRPLAVLAAAVLLWVALPRFEAPVPERADLARGGPGGHPGGSARTPDVVEPELVPDEPARAAAYTPNALELRHGRVRLILLDGPTHDALAGNDDDNPNSNAETNR